MRCRPFARERARQFDRVRLVLKIGGRVDGDDVVSYPRLARVDGDDLRVTELVPTEGHVRHVRGTRCIGVLSVAYDKGPVLAPEALGTVVLIQYQFDTLTFI